MHWNLSTLWKCMNCGHEFLAQVEHPCPKCSPEELEVWKLKQSTVVV